jgi:hypothetical protein
VRVFLRLGAYSNCDCRSFPRHSSFHLDLKRLEMFGYWISPSSQTSRDFLQLQRLHCGFCRCEQSLEWRVKTDIVIMVTALCSVAILWTPLSADFQHIVPGEKLKC